MESPHPEWITVGNGYKNAENRLTVSQPDDGWMVGVVAPDAISPPHGPLLVTDDERTALQIHKGSSETALPHDLMRRVGHATL